MHICFISSEYPIWKSGGVGSFLQTIGRALVRSGHKVSILGTGSKSIEEKFTDEGINIYRLPRPNALIGKFWFNTKTIEKKIKELDQVLKIDIVESAELGLAFLNKSATIKYVIRLHGGHHFFAESENRKIDWWQGFKEKQSFKNSDGFIAVSNYVKAHTQRYLSYHNKKITVIPSPINTDLFSPISDIKTEPYNITFVGTICEKKGIRQLIIAMEKILNVHPSAHLNIYGREWYYQDGRSYTEELKNNYSKIIDKCVTFHGVIPFNELPSKYAKAHVCAFPSHMETQGLVAQEAMAMAKPVLFSKKGPGQETIENFITGLLCNPYDIDDIINKILWFFAHPEKAKTIGQNARQFILKNYNLSDSINNNIGFYRELIKA